MNQKQAYILWLSLSLMMGSACTPPVTPTQQSANNPQAATSASGKLVMNFNFGDEGAWEQINPNDFIEVKGFHTQAVITDIAKVRLALSGEKLSAPITRDLSRNEINSSAIVINDLPVGPVEVSVTLLDNSGGNLASEQKLVKVVADKITPVEFNLTLINEVGVQTDSPTESATGGLAISVNIKEETRLYGRTAVSQPVVQVGEPVKVRVEDVQGEVSQFHFDMGDGSGTKTQKGSSAIEQTFSQPGVYQIQTKLQDKKGDTFVTTPVPVKVVTSGSATSITSMTYQPKVMVTVLNRSTPVALQGQGTFDQNGEGFPPHTAVKLYFQRPDNGMYDPLNKTTDGQGRFTHQWSPSSTAQVGTYTFWASYNFNGQTKETNRVTYRVDEAKGTINNGGDTALKTLNVPLLGQREAAWAKQPLGTCKKETIGSDGCTITSVAMVFKYHGITTDPGQLNRFLTPNGGYASGCLLSWGALKKASQGKLSDREISQSEVSNYLNAGMPIVAKLVGYLAYEHWVVITGIQTNGQYLINDPWHKKTTSVPTTMAKKFHVLVK